MKRNVIYLIIMFFMVTRVVAQSKPIVYRYEGKFNNRFERSDNFSNYTGWLIVEGDRSLFTMKKAGNSSGIVILVRTASLPYIKILNRIPCCLNFPISDSACIFLQIHFSPWYGQHIISNERSGAYLA